MWELSTTWTLLLAAAIVGSSLWLINAKTWPHPTASRHQCWKFSSVQLLSHVQLFATPWTACSTPGFPVHHQLLELAQTHVHRVSDAIQPSYPLSFQCWKPQAKQLTGWEHSPTHQQTDCLKTSRVHSHI